MRFVGPKTGNRLEDNISVAGMGLRNGDEGVVPAGGVVHGGGVVEWKYICC